jgi:hypothetical protein
MKTKKEIFMRKITLTLTLVTLVLILSACGEAASEGSAPQTSDEAREFSMPPEMALMVGTVKLDETEYVIQSDQAAELIPLWKALRSLSESETASSVEVEALINQIEDTMTDEQMDVITAMELSMEDTRAVQEQLGIEGGMGGGNMDPEMQATMQAASESGEMPAGGPGGGMGPGGGQGPSGGGAEMNPAARETAMAERGGTRGANIAINTTFLNAIIEFLEAKTSL